MIDYNSVRKHIRFSIEHHGTKTQGEAHRFDQVADHITELFVRLTDANNALNTAMQDYDSSIIIQISVDYRDQESV